MTIKTKTFRTSNDQSFNTKYIEDLEFDNKAELMTYILYLVENNKTDVIIHYSDPRDHDYPSDVIKLEIYDQAREI
jgi:hypothetical protein